MSEIWAICSIVAPFTYALYVLVMAGVLRLCGVAKTDVAAWALRQAGRQRFTDLISAARRVGPATGDKEVGP